MLFYIFVIALFYGYFKYISIIFRQNIDSINYILKPRILEIKHEVVEYFSSNYKKLTLNINEEVNTSILNKVREMYNSMIAICLASREKGNLCINKYETVNDISFIGPIKDNMRRNYYANLYTGKRLYPDKYKIQNMVEFGSITIDNKIWKIIYIPVESKGVYYLPVADSNGTMPNYKCKDKILYPVVNSNKCSYMDAEGNIIFTTRRKQFDEFKF